MPTREADSIWVILGHWRDNTGPQVEAVASSKRKAEELIKKTASNGGDWESFTLLEMELDIATCHGMYTYEASGEPIY